MSQANKKRITVNVVKSLKPGETVWDISPVGLAARCQRSAKVYCLKYRFKGRQRWLTIGKHGSPWTPDTARTEAERLLGMVAVGDDPAVHRDAERKAPTMKEALERFLSDHIKKKRKAGTAAEYARLLDKIILPNLGRHRVKDVVTADITHLHLRLSKTPYQANRCIALLSKFFNWTELEVLRPQFSNPCRHVEKFKEAKRERMLSPEELGRLGDALAAFSNRSPYTVAAIKLLVFTGARLNEILTLRWDSVDMEQGEIRLADSKTGAKTIHVPPPALAVLEELPKVHGNPYVIVGQKTGRHLVNLAKPWRAIRGTAGLDDVRIHDLRHAFASVAVSSGMSLPIIGKILGHSQPQTTARYAHLAADPVKAAAARVADTIAAAMLKGKDRGANVVPLRPGHKP
jgi:integrase